VRLRKSVCHWEDDVFLSGPDEASNANHGIPQNEARQISKIRGVLQRNAASCAPAQTGEANAVNFSANHFFQNNEFFVIISDSC